MSTCSLSGLNAKEKEVERQIERPDERLYLVWAGCESREVEIQIEWPDEHL